MAIVVSEAKCSSAMHRQFDAPRQWIRLIGLVAAFVFGLSLASAQNPPSQVAPTQDAPSLDAPSQSRIGGVNFQLPKDAGQYWEQYDIRTYTQQLKSVPNPEQVIVDWVLRETGTDVWFGKPMGVLSADRDTLYVYHTAAMHRTVQGVYEKLVRGILEPQAFTIQLITVNNPNWRTRAIPFMKQVNVQSSGVDAWLLSKENTAIVLALLRNRTDFREVQSLDLVTQNGQSHTLEQMRSRNYVHGYQRTEQGWPPYMPVSTEIREGYRVVISPLLNPTLTSIDLVLQCEVDQIEKLREVNVDLPMPTGEVQTAVINVPQVVSWRLHERFQWSAEQSLLLSCGVVAAPAGTSSDTLLGQSSNTLGLNKLFTGNDTGRADALLLIQYKGNANSQILTPQTQAVPQTASSMSRGRY